MKKLAAEYFFFNLTLVGDWLSTLLLLGSNSNFFYETNPLIMILFGPFKEHVTMFFLIIFLGSNFLTWSFRHSWKKTAWLRDFLCLWSIQLLISMAANLHLYSAIVVK